MRVINEREGVCVFICVRGYPDVSPMDSLSLFSEGAFRQHSKIYVLPVHVYCYIFEFVYALPMLCSVYGCCKYRPIFRLGVSNIIFIADFLYN